MFGHFASQRERSLNFNIRLIFNLLGFLSFWQKWRYLGQRCLVHLYWFGLVLLGYLRSCRVLSQICWANYPHTNAWTINFTLNRVKSLITRLCLIFALNTLFCCKEPRNASYSVIYEVAGRQLQINSIRNTPHRVLIDWLLSLSDLYIPLISHSL